MLGKKEKMERIKYAAKQICAKCEKDTGKKDIDECFKKCPWQAIFNQMIEEAELL